VIVFSVDIIRRMTTPSGTIRNPDEVLEYFVTPLANKKLKRKKAARFRPGTTAIEYRMSHLLRKECWSGCTYCHGPAK
jgi:hypothetical protein